MQRAIVHRLVLLPPAWHENVSESAAQLGAPKASRIAELRLFFQSCLLSAWKRRVLFDDLARHSYRQSTSFLFSACRRLFQQIIRQVHES